MTALSSVTRAHLIPTDFAIDSLAFGAFVDDGVAYLTANRQFVAAKRTPHTMMMDDDMHPVHVAANCDEKTNKQKIIRKHHYNYYLLMSMARQPECE